MTHDIKRIFRFLLAGVVNTAFGYMSYSVFLLAQAPLWLCVVGSLFANILFNFFTYGGFVFKVRSMRHFMLFVLFYAALAGLNILLLNILIGWGASGFLAQFLLLPPLAVIAYIGLNWGVFGAWTATPINRHNNSST